MNEFIFKIENIRDQLKQNQIKPYGEGLEKLEGISEHKVKLKVRKVKGNDLKN